MMTIDDDKPVHVHVGRNTPVHVHLKKMKKKPRNRGAPTAVEDRIRTRDKRMTGIVTRATGRARKDTKSASPPFIPAPAKTSKGSYKWENQTHSLEISPPSRMGTLRMGQLSSSEEDIVNGRMRNYENKITSLMSEVGTLKNEVDLQKSRRQVEKKDEQIAASRKVVEVQEQELYDFKKELKSTVKENEMLRHSLTKAKEDADLSRNELDRAEDDKGTLIKKLVETEMDGKAAGEHVMKLRDLVRRLKQDKTLSAADASLLTRQREAMLQKLDEFDRTNKGLRRMLRDTQQKEEEELHLRQQQEVLLRKLTEADSQNENFQIEIMERDRQIETLLNQVEADKDQELAFEDLKKTMETTRAHLQNQFRSKEMENNRLQVQIRSLEEQIEQSRVEVEHLEGILTASRDKSGREKEALKKAARVQKDRVSDREKEIDSVTQKLNDKELEMLEIRRNESALRQEGESAEADIATLRNRIKELQDIIENTEKASHSNTELLTSKLSTKAQEVNAIRTENEQLRSDIAAFEERLHEDEQRALTKIDKYRREAEDTRNRLYDVEQDTQLLHQETMIETEKQKLKMQHRMSELEPLADLLKSTELRLQDSQDRLLNYERRASEHTKLIAELTQKVEMQTDQLEHLREKYRTAQDELRNTHSKSDYLDKKTKESEQQNRELIGVLGKKDESLQHNQQRLEDLRAENIRLTSQLESSLSEARRQAELQREKNVAKERAAQARIVDLETQLSRATSSAASMKRAKDEAERRFNSKLHDMKDRLEQANSTTRSMQNYVSFLKSSYSDVFDELESPR